MGGADHGAVKNPDDLRLFGIGMSRRSGEWLPYLAGPVDNSIVIARPGADVRLMNLPSLTTHAYEVQTMDSGPHVLDDDFVNDSFRLCFRGISTDLQRLNRICPCAE